MSVSFGPEGDGDPLYNSEQRADSANPGGNGGHAKPGYTAGAHSGALG